MSQADLDNQFKPSISAKFNISGMSDNELRSKLAIMNIFYEKLELTEITQIPVMTSVDLMSTVGGLLGII